MLSSTVAAFYEYMLADSLRREGRGSPTLIEGGDLGALPLPLLAQAFSLPILFGVLSQAIAYRRAIARLA